MSVGIAAALLVALAVSVLLLPPRRDASVLLAAAGSVPPPSPQGVGAPGTDESSEDTALGAVGDDDVSELTVMERLGDSDTELDLGLVLTEVATLLRAGLTSDRAWHRVLARRGLRAGTHPEPDGVPPVLLALARPQTWRERIHSFCRGLCCSAHSQREPCRPTRTNRAIPGRAARRQMMTAAIPGAVAACRLSATLGAPLADILDTVAHGVDDASRAAHSRRTALAGPRSTARLLAALPLIGLALGGLIGAHPQQFFLDGGVGSALGIAAVGAMAGGHILTRRLVSQAHVHADGVDEALVLDLAAAALTCGASIPTTLTALGQALEEDACAVVARSLMLGAGWEEAWQAPEDDPWRQRRATLADCLEPGWNDGASPMPLLAATATSLRDARRADDDAAAARLAVRLVVPLGLCHLPAFILLGIVPVVLELGRGVMTW